MFTAPAVACEISAPPTTPRGTSRSSSLGFTTFMGRSLRAEPVVQPLLARAPDAVVDRPAPARGRSRRHPRELPARDVQHLAVDEVRPRRAEEEHAARRLLRR